MRGGQGLGDLGSGTETGVHQPILPQSLERFAVKRRASGLHDGLAIVVEAEPFQILENAVYEFRSAPAGIEILDPQPELAAARSGMSMAQRRRVCVTEVQAPGGRRGETCDLQDSLHAKGDIGEG
jgi:hypothetical protein